MQRSSICFHPGFFYTCNSSFKFFHAHVLHQNMFYLYSIFSRHNWPWRRIWNYILVSIISLNLGYNLNNIFVCAIACLIPLITHQCCLFLNGILQTFFKAVQNYKNRLRSPQQNSSIQLGLFALSLRTYTL